MISLIAKTLKIDKENEKVTEIINYLIIGVCSTIVSIVSYFLLRLVIENYMICTALSWIITIIFTYITNRKFVFTEHDSNIFREMTTFLASRIATLIVELACMYVAVDMLSIDDRVAKIVVQVIVIVLNYILSKLFVFKRKD